MLVKLKCILSKKFNCIKKNRNKIINYHYSTLRFIKTNVYKKAKLNIFYKF